MKPKNNHISYIEFRANNLESIKLFYATCFNWKFTDYGPDYTSFSESGIQGGFEKLEDKIVNGVLIVLYHTDLDSIKNKIITEGGSITKKIFSFPGGKRFQFTDPSGNELAVWSDK
tara:strand:+ start:266 stop:613 length:348 start_codon:yes stop_codon:yes gene_type:complete